jgi:hypothetical protein
LRLVSGNPKKKEDVVFQILTIVLLVVLLGGCAAEQGAFGGYRMVVWNSGEGVQRRKPDPAYTFVPPSGEKKPDGSVLIPKVYEVEVWYYSPLPRYGYNPYPQSYSGLTYQSYPLFSYGGGHRHHYHYRPCPPTPCPRPHVPCPSKKKR